MFEQYSYFLFPLVDSWVILLYNFTTEFWQYRMNYEDEQWVSKHFE